MSQRLMTGRSARLAVALSAMMLLFGCGYNRQTAAMHDAYEQGDFSQAAIQACELADKADKRDQVVLRLEQGAVLRAAGQFQASNDAFDRADELVSEYDQKADFRISQEAASAIVNQTMLDYQGYAYDRIMLNTYKALNCLELGDFERARVEFRRAYERQRQAVEKYHGKIEADEQVRKDKQGDYDVDRAMEDERFKSGLEDGYSDLQAEDLSAYENYVNPFTEYLHGLFLMAAATDASDMEQAATALRRAAGLVQENSYVAQDMALAERVASGGRIEPTTYVIFETGIAPERREIRIDIPLFLVNNKVDYFGVNFPRLKDRPCGCEQIMVQTSGGSYPTAVLCDMDKVISQEFKNEMPLVITRTLISAGVKAAAAYAANEATRKNNTGNDITRILMTGYQVVTNQADLRTWKSLPKRFCLARFPTPADRQIRIALPSGAVMPPIQLQDAVVNIVYVKSVHPARPPVIRQFKLR